MRTAKRDRCGPAVAISCAALVILLFAVPAAALSAEYTVFPNGTAYEARIGIINTDRYEFSDVGVLGEKIPLDVWNVSIEGNCSPCSFNWTTPPFLGTSREIMFERGNYTVSYIAPLKDSHLQENFRTPYRVNVTLPQEFDVRNPLLAGISPGATVTRHDDNTTSVEWNKTISFDLRFYDPGREELLYFFLQMMAILVVVFVVIPYVMMRTGRE